MLLIEAYTGEKIRLVKQAGKLINWANSCKGRSQFKTVGRYDRFMATAWKRYYRRYDTWLYQSFQEKENGMDR